MTTISQDQHERRPFPNGIADIYNDDWWKVLPAAFRAAPWSWRARTALAATFDNDFLVTQTFRSHPLAFQSIFRFGRWAIFRLGLAMSRLSVSTRTQSRLVAKDLYEACANELDVGLFLSASCSDIMHEPSASSSGPDFFAKPRATKLGWEVKHPHQSEHFQAREQLTRRISESISSFASGAVKARGWGLGLAVQDGRLAEATQDPTSEHDLLAALHGRISEWAKRPSAGHFVAAVGVTFTARRCSTPSVSTSGPGFVGDTRLEIDRLVNVQLTKAAGQLDRGGVPGVIVLAREASGLVGNYARTLAQTLRAEPKKFESVLGIMIYDNEVNEHAMLVSRADLYLRSEARSLARELSVLQYGGRLGIRFF